MIPYTLFHELLENLYQLIYLFLTAVADILRHTLFNVLGKKYLCEAVERAGCRGHLGQNIHAVCIVLDHSANTADLSLNAVQTSDEILFFSIRSTFMTAAKAFLFFLAHCNSFLNPQFF